ncbi:DUF1206 domain-containing protein [Oculatella sp. LEGE 06141]|uniref:DUF1206 domain-containing protein n=1 Tax=Oculatella sp. LEGE 06141 TaxID=1828648 RepID=UPI00187E7E81|nr:DUF1206 domain-containing protein [Oculatella sp. LEGE 06141]MBE9179622.1 DUF1206 domain-containing protein [Oculatella sp. LEGE 06141]
MPQDSSDWIERFARFGFAAKGFVYAVVGLLATQAAIGSGGDTTDPQGALEAIVTQPFGRALLALVGVGLVSYALWRLIEAILDPGNSGSDAKGLGKRAGYGLNAFIYFGIALGAIKLSGGANSTGSDSEASTQDWTARILEQPFGQWLVGLGGALVIGLGFYYFYRAYKAEFRKDLKWREMNSTEQTWVTRIGRIGHIARGIVFTIIGLFLIQAARRSDASEAVGLGGALATLAEQPYGPIVLGVVAVGLFAYGIYTISEAKYRRIFAPNVDMSRVNSMINQ